MGVLDKPRKPAKPGRKKHQYAKSHKDDLLAELSVRQARFVLEILKSETLSGPEAARIAGYKNPYTDAVRLVKHPKIKRLIEIELQSRMRRARLTSDRVLAELSFLGFSNISNLFDNNGELIPVENLPYETAVAVKSYDVQYVYDRYGNKKVAKAKITMHDKIKPLELICRAVGAIENKLGINIEGSVDVVMSQILTVIEQERTAPMSNVVDAEYIHKIAESPYHAFQSSHAEFKE